LAKIQEMKSISKQAWSGRKRRLPFSSPHRSGHADFPHPAPQVMASLLSSREKRRKRVENIWQSWQIDFFSYLLSFVLFFSCGTTVVAKLQIYVPLAGVPPMIPPLLCSNFD
jgi:hypothetical protein